jgi:hypothetical protein
MMSEELDRRLLVAGEMAQGAAWPAKEAELMAARCYAFVDAILGERYNRVTRAVGVEPFTIAEPYEQTPVGRKA